MASIEASARLPRLAFIGLGTMGYAMAGHLSKAGYEVTVHNRSKPKAQAWVGEFGGPLAQSPAEAAAYADVILLCVGNDDDVWEVIHGSEGIAQSIRPGTTVFDHSTISAEQTQKLFGLGQAAGWHFVDAPVSGGNIGAQNGTLTVMCGGNAEMVKQHEPVLRCYAKAVTWVGPSGHGQLTKMVNQICIAGIVQGLSEAIAFGQKAGVDMASALEVIGHGAAQSWQLEHRGGTMLKNEFDFGFAVDWMRKDLGLVLAEARRNGASLPLTALVDQFYADVQAMGGGRWDTSSLLKRLK